MSGVIIQQILAGFLLKSIASFDDTLTRIPLLINLTHTLKGRVSFFIGTFLALTVILIIAIFFSNLLDFIPYRNQLIAILIFLLALAVYFEIFTSVSHKKIEKNIQIQTDTARLIRLVLVGFIISFITLLDDMIVLIPLFTGDTVSRFYSLIGVYSATLVQIIIVIFFSKKIGDIKYKKQVASLALLLLSVLIWAGIV